MTTRSLFAIIIKIIGIYLIISSATFIPQLVMMISEFSRQFSRDSSQNSIELVSFFVFTVGFYLLILRYCFFKTDCLIDKLHLAKEFTKEKFELNIHRSTLLKIAVIVIGAMIIVNYLPFLCAHAFSY